MPMHQVHNQSCSLASYPGLHQAYCNHRIWGIIFWCCRSIWCQFGCNPTTYYSGFRCYVLRVLQKALRVELRTVPFDPSVTYIFSLLLFIYQPFYCGCFHAHCSYSGVSCFSTLFFAFPYAPPSSFQKEPVHLWERKFLSHKSGPMRHSNVCNVKWWKESSSIDLNLSI